MATAQQVRAALTAWGGSLSSLAERLGTSHSTLSRIRDGAWPASPELVAGLVRELERKAKECSTAAKALRRAAR
jgi:lambda repressor-like predicted transcriptional regulator